MSVYWSRAMDISTGIQISSNATFTFVANFGQISSGPVDLFYIHYARVYADILHQCIHWCIV